MVTKNLLSLFCGAGGLDLGFVQEGFDVKLAIDFSPSAIETHKFNFPNSNAEQHDLIELGTEGLVKICSEIFTKEEPIGIIGGPPCQGFSRGNVGSSKSDPRNKLAFLYIDVIEALKNKHNVKFVVFENVMGLKDKKHADTYNMIVKRLKNLGFDVHEKELNALDFGVPQIRKRVILIALDKEFSSNSSSFAFDEKIKHKTVRDAISELPEPVFYKKNIHVPYHPNHWTMVPRSVRFTQPESIDNKNRSFRAIFWDKPSPTIAYGNREIYVHPNKKRRLSIYESMLLQGFPKSFIIKGTLSQQVTQISNAVPPPMAKKIAENIKKITMRGIK
ncbi:DNA cytosine methyltransferase [Serratia fonticola]